MLFLSSSSDLSRSKKSDDEFFRAHAMKTRVKSNLSNGLQRSVHKTRDLTRQGTARSKPTRFPTRETRVPRLGSGNRPHQSRHQIRVCEFFSPPLYPLCKRYLYVPYTRRIYAISNANSIPNVQKVVSEAAIFLPRKIACTENGTTILMWFRLAEGFNFLYTKKFQRRISRR